MLRLVLATTLALLAGAAPALADATIVTAGNAFEPDAVTVDVGEKVTITNNGGFHNLKWQDGAPGAEGANAWSVNRTFTEAGTYPFLCEFHEGMDGTVTVKGGGMVRTWAGGTGKWGDSAKWQPAGVPDVNDTAVLGMGAVVEVDVDRQVGTLKMSGGAIRTGTGTLTVVDDLDTPGNAMFTGLGVTIVQPDESFAANTIQLDRGHRMRFEGDLARTGGYFYIGDGNFNQPGDEAGVIEVGGVLTIPTLSNTAGVIGPTDGTGILRILPTGSFTVPAGDFAISAVPENQGTMTINGDVLAYNGVNIAGGITTLTGSITEGDVIMSGGRLTGDGTILDQALRISGGTVAPDGTLTTGGLFMTGGTLEVRIQSDSFDRVIAPAAELAGALNVLPIFLPSSSTTYRIVETSLSAPSGTFASVSKDFETLIDATGVLLKLKTFTNPDPDPDPDTTPTPTPTPTTTPVPTPTPTPSPSPTPTPSPTPSALPSFGSLVKLPKCAARRAVRVTLLRSARVDVFLGRKRLKRTTRTVTLKRLPRRAFKLRFEVKLADGRMVKGSRRFKPCK